MTTAATTPLWLARHVPPALSPFEPEVDTDVCVIGAGIAGLTVALCLLRDGRRVRVLERDGIGAGETLRTSAHLANALDDRFDQLERWHGRDGARIAAESHAAAIDWIEAFVREAGDDCGFARVDGLLFAAPGDEDVLDRELDAAQRAGLEVERVDAVPGIALGPALRFARQARIDIDRYVIALADAVRALGGRIERAEAVDVRGGAPCRVTLSGGATLDAAAVVVATNVPFHERIALHTKLEPYRTYMIAVERGDSAAPDALVWDTPDPYHYVRQATDPDGTPLLIVGGEDHKVGQPGDAAVREPTAALLQWTRDAFPGAGALRAQWSGQVVEPTDGMAFIGRDPGGEANVFVVAGDSGNGLTHGTLAGPLLSALVHGADHPWAQLYDPNRKALRSLREWARINVNVAAQYLDWLRGGDAPGVDALAAGDGAVIRDGIRRVAVCRDEGGALHAFDATCPHVGCAVRWNAREASWDCPCHGSRFHATTGDVLNGPAARGLARLSPPAP